MTKLTNRELWKSGLAWGGDPTLLGARDPGPKRVRDKTNPTEWHEQSALFNWWKVWAPTQGYDVRCLYAVPNGAYLGKDPKQRQITMMFLKRAGLQPGALDLNLDIPKNGLHGLRMEMKSLEGRESADQITYVELHRANGYAAEFCWGAVEGIATIKAYLG